jgi:glycosyltransferase involved in cell wall biosynthesis
MKIAALMLTGSDFYETRAKACFETWLPTFDEFQIHSFTPCDFLPITQVGTREGVGSCFDKRLDGLRVAPDADWYLCCSCDNYVWAENLRAELATLPTDSPAILGSASDYSFAMPDGSLVPFQSGGAGYCLNRAALLILLSKLPELLEEWKTISGGNEAEDVFMGWASGKLGFRTFGSKALNPSHPENGYPLDVEPEKVISLHHLDADQIRALHEKGVRGVFVKSISLCMICGNEEGVILRCLESAKDSFDELCLVAAVGNRQPDKTLYVAEKWCAENGKDFKGGRYQNTYDLPHVDDFGAARNQAFALATKDWQMWLDCDDYMDAINCARIREAVCIVAPDVNGIYGRYLTDKNGCDVPRERLFRRGFGKWKNPIHETCEIRGKSLDCPQIKVYHGDHQHKHQSSAARNAVILRRALEDAPRHYFYLHTELKMLKDLEAAKFGRIALAFELDAEERYVVLLNMSELEPDKRGEYLHEAARIQPHRREAFAYMCKAALIDGRTSDAVSYFRLMDSLPIPSPLPWTHQGIWYRWARNALRVDCLRASGQGELADANHAEYMKDPDYAEGVKDK